APPPEEAIRRPRRQPRGDAAAILPFRTGCAAPPSATGACEVARFEMSPEMDRVERLSAGALRKFRRRPAAGLQPDVLAQPVEDRREVTRGDAGVEAWRDLSHRGEPLRRLHGAQRVAGEVSEQSGRPMDVLHAAVAEVA